MTTTVILGAINLGILLLGFAWLGGKKEAQIDRLTEIIMGRNGTRGLITQVSDTDKRLTTLEAVCRERHAEERT